MGASAVALVEPHLASVGRGVGGGELADRPEDCGELFVVGAHAGIEFGQFGGEGLIPKSIDN